MGDATSRRRVVFNMSANVLSFVVNLAISFILTPYLIRNVGVEAYGFFPLANSIFSYAQVFTAALGAMASRFVVLHYHNGERTISEEYFSTSFFANLVISCVLGVLFTIAIIYAEVWLNVPDVLISDVHWLFSLILIGVLLGIATDSLAVGTAVHNRVDLNALRVVTANIARAIAILLLFSIFVPSIRLVGVATLVGAIVTALLNIVYRKTFLSEFRIKLKLFSRERLKEIASAGVWNSVNHFGIIIRTQLDIILTNIFFGAAVAGDLGAAKTIPVLVTSLVGTLVAVYVPQFTILYARGDKSALLKEISYSIYIMTSVIAVPIGFVIVNGLDFFSLWLPERDAQFLYWLSILSTLQIVVTGSINPLFNIYTVVNKVKVPALVTCLTAVVGTLVIIVALINGCSIWTIPIVSLVVVLMRNLLFTPIYAAHCLQLPWTTFYPNIARGIIACGVVMALTYCVSLFLTPNTWLNLVLGFVIVSVVFLGSATLVLKYKTKK